MSDQADENPEAVPANETYTLRLEGGGVVVNREVDEDVALQIIAAVMGGGAIRPVAGGGMAHPAGRSRPAPSHRPSAGTSARSYIDDNGAKRNVDKILALAAYVVDVRGGDTLTADDVKREFRNAAEPVPGNYARDFRWAVQNDWLAPVDGSPGEYYVTSKGRQALEAKFSGEVKKNTGVSKTARRKRATKATEATT